MQRLSMAVAGATFIALGIGTAPANAALIGFNFDTESGGTGSFILDTGTPPASEPSVVFFDDGSVEEGILYLNAISDFSFSAPDTSFSNLTGDYSVFPSIPYTTRRPDTGVLSIVGPSGCATATADFCSVNIDVEYSGSVSELPLLSNDPLSYPRAFEVLFVDPPTGDFISSDRIINFQAQAVPESDSALGILTVGIGGAGWLLKRKMNRKGASSIKYSSF